MNENKNPKTKRIETIDVLRGFALAGILYAHIVIWYTGASLPTEVYTKYDSTADGIAMGIFGGLVFGKFFSVFSFLFGLSFFLNFHKNKSRPGYLKVYSWRLFLLLLIGIGHHLLWRGDILAIYAVLGLLLIFFRHLPKKFILFVALLLITNIPTHLYEIFQTEPPNAELNFPMQQEAEAYYSLVNKGNLFTVLQENWNSWPAKIKYQLESGRLLMTFGYFLLGFYAGCTQIFTSIDRRIKQITRWNKNTGRASFLLLLIGFLMYINNYVTLPEINIVPKYQGIAAFLFDFYNACLTIFYITGVIILLRSALFSPILKPLAAMGRMALTNYLLQTVFGLMIFYQFGLGLFDKTSLAFNVLIAVFILFIQLNLSNWWLKRYNQGPVEWLWKNFTYFKFSSNTKNKVSSISRGKEAL